MDKILMIREKTLKTNFRRFFKRFLPLSIVIILTGGIAVGFGLRTQILQTAAYLQKMEHAHGEVDFIEKIPVTEVGNGMEAVIAIYLGICLFILAIFWISVAAWLYKKAVRSKMNGSFWLLAGIVSNVFGAALFFLVRSFIRQKCKVCGTWQKKNKWFCAECGAELNRNCRECGELCGPDDHYCSRCGVLLTQADDNAGI